MEIPSWWLADGTVDSGGEVAVWELLEMSVIRQDMGVRVIGQGEEMEEHHSSYYLEDERP